jgi:hypothetical protein
MIAKFSGHAIVFDGVATGFVDEPSEPVTLRLVGQRPGGCHCADGWVDGPALYLGDHVYSSVRPCMDCVDGLRLLRRLGEWEAAA